MAYWEKVIMTEHQRSLKCASARARERRLQAHFKTMENLQAHLKKWFSKLFSILKNLGKDYHASYKKRFEKSGYFMVY